MLNSVIRSFSEKTGVSENKIEKYWNSISRKIKKSYDIDENSEKFYPLLVSILKKYLKLNESFEIGVSSEAALQPVFTQEVENSGVYATKLKDKLFKRIIHKNNSDYKEFIKRFEMPK